MAVHEELKSTPVTRPIDQPMEAAHTESTSNPPSNKEHNPNSV